MNYTQHKIESKSSFLGNGRHPERNILSGIGPLPIRQPRIDDRNLRKQIGVEASTSRILPPYMRRVPCLDNLIPALYLKGISSGDFPRALEAILGKDAPGLSATNIVRLKSCWEEEYKVWRRQDLSDKNYAYFWVDGIYFNVRLDEDRVCLLVIIAADESGKKELLAFSDGYRESKLSWEELLRDLKRRGLWGKRRLEVVYDPGV